MAWEGLNRRRRHLLSAESAASLHARIHGINQVAPIPQRLTEGLPPRPALLGTQGELDDLASIRNRIGFVIDILQQPTVECPIGARGNRIVQRQQLPCCCSQGHFFVRQPHFFGS